MLKRKKTANIKVDKSINSRDVRENLQDIGDKTKKKYDESGDLKAADLAIKAYGKAVNTAKAQLIYKNQTGSPEKISFFEED
ncbi:MAG: hypothetical protein ACI9AT_000435 [Ulvibacter sp.]|jgi:hypothetical protein